MTSDPKSQPDKFRDLARDLEANEDEAAFEETLKRIAPKGHATPDAPLKGPSKD